MFDTLTRLSFLMEASRGNTKAHQFIHECGVKQLRIYNIRSFILNDKVKYFIPPNRENTTIIMFSDNSGVDVCRENPKLDELHPIFMSSDISSWTVNYTEVDNPF
jgi:hypothetical protein